MHKGQLGVLLVGCLILTGCTLPFSFNSSTSEVTSDEASLVESSATSSETIEPTVAPAATINCDAYGITADVTGVKYTSSPNSVTMQFTVGELFTIEETIEFAVIKMEQSDYSESESSSSEEVIEVTCTDVIIPGTVSDIEKCQVYLDAGRFSSVEFQSLRNKYTATSAEPILLQKAPITSYVECKSYCEVLYKELSTELENNQAILDGATGILYHTIGGNTFTLTDYRLHVSRGESVKIEIQNLPEGFSLADVTFHSDAVGYASVSRDGTVTGNRNGTATITVSLKGAAVYCTVYVQVF